MLLSRVRERDFVGNIVPENMTAAEKRLDQLSEATVADAETWDWGDTKKLRHKKKKRAVVRHI